MSAVDHLWRLVRKTPLRSTMTQPDSSARLRSIGPDIWLVEGGHVPFLGLQLPTKATIIRLSSGALWVHSPVSLDEVLVAEIAVLGDVCEIVAPNKFHHLFLAEWARRYPSARLHAPPGLAAKRPDIAFAEELGSAADPAWAGDIRQVVFSGSAAFEEVIFFHVHSGVAILTDLIVNIRLEEQSLLGRWVARLDGIAFPHGGVPHSYRLSIRNRRRARSAVDEMLDWAPQHVVISHGEGFERDATNVLRQRFAWLRA